MTWILLCRQQIANGQLYVGNGLATAGQATVSGGLNVVAGGMTVSGGFILSTGSQYVSSPAAGVDAMSVKSTAGSGNALSGRVAASTAAANLMTLSDGTTTMFQVHMTHAVCWCGVDDATPTVVGTSQVKSNGFTTIANGLSIASGGLSVVGGLGGATGLASSGGPVSIDNGKLATTSTATNAAGLDVYASHATFAGNVLLGKVSSGQTAGNALQLLEGANVLLQVRRMVTRLSSCFT